MLIVFVLCIAAVGCGGRAPEPVTQLSQVDTSVPPGAASGESGQPEDDDAAANAGVPDAPAGSIGPQRKGPNGTSRQDGQDQQPAAESTVPPTVPDFPTDVVEVSATVEPACVKPGGDATITVTTRPDAGVGYHAFYSDGKGGGPPPYGNSYGGNDGGLADEDGQYSGTWTVAPTAPSGPGRVDVVVGHDGEFGSTSAAFSVADALTGTCAQ
jgi:hypothetical protein